MAAQRQGLLAPTPLELLKLATRSLVNGLAYLMIGDGPQVRNVTPKKAAEVAEQVTRVLAWAAPAPAVARRNRSPGPADETRDVLSGRPLAHC